MTRPPVTAAPSPGVVLVGPVPPPVHGQAVADQLLLDGEYDRIEVTGVGLKFSRGIDDVGQPRVGKLADLVRSLGRIHRARRRTGAGTLVYSVGVKNLVGVLRDTVLLLSARPSFERTILHVHTGGIAEVLDGAPWPVRALSRRAYGRSHAVIRLASGPADPVFTSTRSYVLPNGVDVPAHVEAAVRRRRPTERAPQVLFLGNLYESKGPGVLVDACTRMAAEGITFELVLAGDAPDRRFLSRLEDQIGRSPVASHVRLTGPLSREEAWGALLDADVFCFPTYYEGESLPLVVIEAMACGLPVVASDWRSIDQLVDHGHTGILVPPRDPAALAAQLGELVTDGTRARALGRAGRERYEQTFTVERFRRGFEAIVADAIGLTVGDEGEALTDR